MIMLTDLSFFVDHPHFKEYNKHGKGVLVFTVDVPAIFSDSVMFQLRSYLQAGFFYEYLVERSFSYDVYCF